MDPPPAHPSMPQERKAVKDLINYSFEAWKLDEAISACSGNSKEVDGWVSNRNPEDRDKAVKTATRKNRDPKKHFRSFSARKTPVVTKDKSVNALLSAQSFDDLSDNPTTESELLATSASASRPPRVIQPFGYSSGTVSMAKDLLKQFPPRKPRRDTRVFPYVAYSLVKQAAAAAAQYDPPKVTVPRRHSQPLPAYELPIKPAPKPPRPAPAVLKEANSLACVKSTGPVQKDDKENKVGVTDRTFQENVLRFMQPTTQEMISLQQKQVRRLSTSIALAKYNL